MHKSSLEGMVCVLNLDKVKTVFKFTKEMGMWWLKRNYSVSKKQSDVFLIRKKVNYVNDADPYRVKSWVWEEV